MSIKNHYLRCVHAVAFLTSARAREPDAEAARRLLAEADLDKAALKELVSGNGNGLAVVVRGVVVTVPPDSSHRRFGNISRDTSVSVRQTRLDDSPIDQCAVLG
jgi:hypothetical protein